MINEVSVIMSEYNTPPCQLKKAIQSILDQTYTQFEFIIVNDGKSKQLEKIVREINDDRIIIVQNEKNIGLPKSLNKAIDKAKNEYLVRMDTDDIAYPNRIARLVEYITAHPEYAVVGSSIQIFDENGEREKIIRDVEINRNLLMKRIAPVHPSVIMKKSAIKSVGGYKNYNRCEDFVLWSELLLSDYKIRIIPDILLKYHLGQDDFSKRKLKHRRDELKARWKYYNKMGATPIQKLSIIKSVISALIPSKILYKYKKG